MSDFNIHSFVKDLKLKKYFTQKQTPFIDKIYIYINDLNVYKVIIVANQDSMKTCKKLGLLNIYNIYEKDFGKITLEYDAAKNGKFIVIYDPKNLIANLYTGEESESQQINDMRKHYSRKIKFR